MTEIHTEAVPDRRGRIAKLRDRLKHSHYPARRTWTMDDSTWDADPNALDHCECGATRRLWRPTGWKTPA